MRAISSAALALLLVAAVGTLNACGPEPDTHDAPANTGTASDTDGRPETPPLVAGTPEPAADPRPIDPIRVEVGDWFDPEAAATVLVFTRDDCPVSNRYAPALTRLHDELSPRGARFLRVYPDPDATPESMASHGDEYGYPFDAVADPDHALVEATGATVTPEAVVLDPDGNVVYRGRIDDRWVSVGQARQAAGRHDLRDAVEALLTGDAPATPVAAEAVGCYLEDLR